MGTWGTAILQNDTTADIWAEFKEYYNKGLAPKDIRAKLEKEYRPENDEEYYGEIWTGIAYGQWMVGELEDYTLKKVKASTSKKWLALWSEDQKLLDKRINALTEFIKRIQIPRPKTLKIKKIIARPALFKVGDIISIKVSDDKYLAALVFGQNENPIHGENEILFTDLLFHKKPTLKEVLNSNILYLDMGGPDYYHRGFFWAIFSARNMSKRIKDTFKLHTVRIQDYLSFRVGIGIGDWNKVGELFFEQVNFLKRYKSDRPFVITINDFLKPKKQLRDKAIEWDKKIWSEHIERNKKKAT